MTLGNSPQPLTRRQLRELARESETAAISIEPAGTPDVPENEVPKPHQSRHTAPVVDVVAAANSMGKPAAPAVDEPVATPVEKPSAQRAEKPAPKPADKPDPSADAAAAPAPRPAPAPLPIPGQAPAAGAAQSEPVPANAVVIDSVVVDPGPTLTRRELRALHAAASAGPAPISSAPVSSAPVSSAPVRPAPIGSATPAATPRATIAESEPVPTVSGLNPPIGHWSVDPDDDSHIQTIGRRDDQTFDDLVGNGVGAGGIPTTTNALILPAIPRQGSSGPITSTGEIMITGSIDLPRSLGATGQHPNLFDSSEMDRMLDQLDEGGHHNDVAPVSASRAVSTHTSTRGVMTPPRKRGASLPTVLAITAAVLAIGVLSLFVVGYAFNIY
jgi:hypothetical protein